MIKYIIKENNGTGIIADENNNPRYFDDGESAADWAEKNDVDPDAWIITKKNIISQEEQSKVQSLRESALKEQEDYKRLDKAVGNDWYHLGSDAFLGEWVPDKNQGKLGKTYDAFSYPLKLSLGGIEGLAKTIYGGLESGAEGVQRVAEGKDLNKVEQELTNPINLASMAVSPGASSLVRYGFGKLSTTALGRGIANVLGRLGAPGKFALDLPKSFAGTVTNEGIAQGALAVPQTGLENLTRSSKGGEPLDYSDMALYSALGGAFGEIGSRSLQGLAKKTLQSEVKVRPSVAQKDANPPDPDWLLNVPRKFIDLSTLAHVREDTRSILYCYSQD